MGPSGNPSGPFGRRTGGPKGIDGDVPFLRPHENAIDRALRWLAKHQGLNGRWGVADYFQNCTEVGAKCEPGQAHDKPHAAGDIACTAYALLCFLANGHVHTQPNTSRGGEKRIDYLVSQEQEGRFAQTNNMYAIAVATLALVEASAMAPEDRALRRLRSV